MNTFLKHLIGFPKWLIEGVLIISLMLIFSILVVFFALHLFPVIPAVLIIDGGLYFHSVLSICVSVFTWFVMYYMSINNLTLRQLISKLNK